MKVRSIGKSNRGFSTLEILIAFAILILCIGAVIMVVFGNQSIAVDTETNNEAIYKAQKVLEQARALSRQDFNSVISASSTSISTIPYALSLSIADLTQCKKQATSTITWNSFSRPQIIELSTFFTDIVGALALGGDCIMDQPFGDWSHPIEMGFLNLTPGGSATGIDVFNKKAYISLSDTPNLKPDITIIDVTSSTTPILLKSTDVKNEPGFNAIDVATSTDGHLYAYIANDNAIGQFVIMDVTVPTNPIFIASSTLPGITTGVGRSIFYYEKKIYIGTQYFVCAGCNELHIYDVSIPSNPIPITSINVNRNVNAIYVRNGLAYLATGPGTPPAHNPLKIFDVNPSSPTYKQEVGSFAATGNEEGTSIYLVGNRAYLGLEHAGTTRPDFYVLNINFVSSVSEFASIHLGLNSSSAVTGIRVAGNLAFLGISDPNKGFQVLDISKNPIGNVGAFNFQQDTTGIDFSNNTVYLPSNSGSRTLEIVGPGP